MKSKIFYSDKYHMLESNILKFLNSQSEFLSPFTINSTRAVGDAIQEMLAQKFDTILGDLSENYSSNFSRRAMADLAFTDKEGNYYIVDVKTHRLDSNFNMPNLTSVERLARFYEDNQNYFLILNIAYNIIQSNIIVEKVNFIPIEFISWNCLTIGALGWGQIQISNSNIITIINNNNRKRWMLELCEVLFEFYPKEIDKIATRIEYFKRIKNFWESKTE